MQLFRPTRGGPRPRQKKESVRTWTGHFFCIADRFATKPPKTSEKLALQNAGLGLKKIQFQETDTEEALFANLTSSNGFPQLKDVGGFELLHCQSNCRELQLITCPWSVACLKKVIGTQSKIYIRPIQRNLKVVTMCEEGPTSLKETCTKCSKLFSITELREHVSECFEVEDDGFLPDLGEDITITELDAAVVNVISTPLVDQTLMPISSDNSSAVPEPTENQDLNSVDLPRLFDNVQSSSTSNDTNWTHPISQSIAEIVDSFAQYCLQNGILDPTEILRLFQKKIVTGRRLDIEDESAALEGETNFILVDRNRLLDSAIDEIEGLENLRTCLEVQFYGEASVDLGGPRKEFFVLALREMKEKYFEPVKEWSHDYETIGKIMALSMHQNGKLPRMLTSELVEELFNENCRPFMKDLRKGLDSLGLYKLAGKLPSLVHVFTPGSQAPLTVKKLSHLLHPIFSEEGSNRKKIETTVYSNFVKYMREAASGRRGSVTLNTILQFVTGADEEPILGFTMHPSISFVLSSTSFLPTSNTCINRLNLFIPEKMEDVPSNDILFELYDYSFCNSYFGLK